MKKLHECIINDKHLKTDFMLIKRRISDDSMGYNRAKIEKRLRVLFFLIVILCSEIDTVCYGQYLTATEQKEIKETIERKLDEARNHNHSSSSSGSSGSSSSSSGSSNSYNYSKPTSYYNGTYYESAAKRDAAIKAEKEKKAEAARVKAEAAKKEAEAREKRIEAREKKVEEEVKKAKDILQRFNTDNPDGIENLINMNDIVTAWDHNTSNPDEMKGRAAIDKYIAYQKRNSAPAKKLDNQNKPNNGNAALDNFISPQTLKNMLSPASTAVSNTIDVLNSPITDKILSIVNEIFSAKSLKELPSLTPNMKEDLEKTKFSMDVLALLGDNEKKKEVINTLYSKIKEVVRGMLPAGELYDKTAEMADLNLSYSGNITDFFSELKELILKSVNNFNEREWDEFLNKWFGKWGSFSTKEIQKR